MIPVRITGTGSCVPPTVITNDELVASLPPQATSSAWIEQNLGIRNRHIVIGETAADLAQVAAEKAMAAASIVPGQVDIIILATTTPERVAPSTASLVAGRIGAQGAVAFDVAAVCSGWMYALSIAQHMLATGSARRALVIGADAFSLIADWRNRDCVYFGDGAGAVVLEQGAGPGAIAAMRLDAYADDGESFTVPPGQTTYVMDGPAVKRQALAVLPAAIRSLVDEHGLRMADIDWIVPHQAGIGVLRCVAERLDYPLERVLTSMGEYGNTAAASIPMTLDLAVRAGTIRRGQRIVLASVGAGWTWAVGLMTW